MTMASNLTQNKVRVRFAPSPTGSPHLGSARTALFNWLFARHHGGVFVLRIEDTDTERSTRQYEREIIESLKWLDISWDEGPDIGGPHGPYHQMDRLTLYNQYVDKLFFTGAVYKCFCSPQELERERKAQQGRGEPPKYGGRCARLSTSEIADQEASGRRSVVRFRVPSREIIFNDLIRGPVRFNGSLIGDFIIVKSDGVPIFLFSNVVDDIEMNITHVIRGEEHLSNTPKQILLYDVLNQPLPSFAHLPILLGPDRSKLSKRHGAESVLWYRDQGFLPDALLNFLALLGWNPGGNQEIFTRDELIAKFSLERVQKGGAIFTVEKLRWMSGQYVSSLTPEQLTRLALPELIQKGLIAVDERGYRLMNGSVVSAQYVNAAVELSRSRAKSLKDIVSEIDFMFRDSLTYDASILIPSGGNGSHTIRVLKSIQERFLGLNDESFTATTLPAIAREIISEMHASSKEVLWPLRVALTGKRNSPGVYEVLVLLGKTRALARVDAAQRMLNVKTSSPSIAK